MMNLLVRSSNAKDKKRSFWHSAEENLPAARLMIVIAAGFLLVLSGCGIPGLRCAQPGPTLPATFYRPYNWPVPLISWPRHTGSDDDDREPDDMDTNSDGQGTFNAVNVDGPVRLTSFMGYADTEGDNESASADKDATKPDVDAAGPQENVPLPEFGMTSVENSAHLLWCEFFNDPILLRLIGQALAGNQELKILAEEIWIANNEIEARRGEYLPFVTLGSGAGLEKSSRFTREGAVEEALEVAPSKPFPDPLPDFLVAANVSWEVDIWRKLRNARDAAAFRYLGTRDGQNYVVTRLIAEVAENYYELLALDNRLATLDTTIEIQQQSLRVAQAKKEAGRGTELAVQRFQAEVRKNQSERLVIMQEVIESENRLNFNLGRYPQPVERASLGFIDINLRGLNVGAPAQLLRNRPDIRQAENELAAAGLDVDVARARFYPSLDIFAGVGYRAFDPGFLFSTPEALIYHVAGELVGPLINKKAIQAAYRTANAKQIQSVYNYQRTVLNAYTEVITHITKVESYGNSIEIKRQQLRALEASVDAATKLFQNARVEYVEVLLAQREMMEARLVLIDTKRQQLAAVVNTYQALGGGAPTGFN